MSRTRVKICGIRTVDAARAAADAGADAIGLVFHEASPRFIPPEDAARIICRLPPMVASVGVFVDTPIDRFCDIEEVCPTTFSQLHGSEDEKLVRACGPGVIRGIRFDDATIARELDRWDAIEEVDAILVDGSTGGEGVTLDWHALAPHTRERRAPIILAGGLTPQTVAAAIRAVRPWAVDVSSGVESAPGVKDPALIEAFCEAVRRADLG